MNRHPKYEMRTLETRPDGAQLKASHLSFMDPEIVYSLCMLRQDVFILEQQVTSEQELDGLDREDSTITLWWEKDGDVIGTIRVFPGDGCMRIGRLACAKSARRGGFGGALMAAAIDLCKERESTQKIVIHGQSYLKGWYESLGYVTVSDEFEEAGIAHYTMEYRHP
ncbi:GNAT family N-acetyltransferase [Dermabacter sp. p3-SID358]|uniref:GNAT family N-acetyltransferase n=1 Tax=Dermabacter sp. p3-SID358 TaxID=2916114 RepID=UPI0021A905DA|nr:GNAT family N-acetyltransferase [Dermabacter sp. p3-SID358]MCT1867331.1 GNAT family N-acetyltransferase [Dermabacter sp. p3-SID358]